MKNLFMLLIAAVISTSALSNKNSNILTISGDYLSQKKVHYEVFQVVDESTTMEVRCGINKKSFSIDLQTGFKYVVKFTSSDGITKCLYVNAEIGGEFQVNVDFKLQGSAQMSYSYSHRNYYILRLKTKEVLYAQAKRNN